MEVRLASNIWWNEIGINQPPHNLISQPLIPFEIDTDTSKVVLSATLM